MNAPHQLNEPLTYMPIPDSPYGWQEKMFSINSLGLKLRRTCRSWY